MAFVLELTVFSHHDDGDILERHLLLSDPNAENVALLRDNVAEAFEMSGYQPEQREDYEHYYTTPIDRESYAVGLRIVPTLFNEEPGPRTLSSTLSTLARFDLGTHTVPHASAPGQQRVLLVHSHFQEPPSHVTPVAIGTSAQLQTHRERLEALLESLGFTHTKEMFNGDLEAVLQLESTSVYFSDVPLEVNLGSTDTQLLRTILNATALDDLNTFSHNPKGLKSLLHHGLLQWD